MMPSKLLRVISIFIAFTIVFTNSVSASESKKPVVTTTHDVEVSDTEDNQPRIPPIGDMFIDILAALP